MAKRLLRRPAAITRRPRWRRGALHGGGRAAKTSGGGSAYEAALRRVPAGEVVTYAELALMATGRTTLGAVIHAGRAVGAVQEETLVPWWRAVAAGKPCVSKAVQKSRATTQRVLLHKEGVALERRLERSASCVPRFLAPVFDTVVIEPSAPHNYTLVYLHGRAFAGGYYAGHPDFFTASRSASLRVVLPTAPPPCPEQLLPTQWFAGCPPGDVDFRGPRKIVLELLRCEVSRLQGQAHRVFLGGASQGCILGLDVYMRRSGKQSLGGFLGVIGHWPRCSDALLVADEVRSGRPVRLFNGGEDSIIPLALVQAGVRKLRNIGLANLKSVITPGVGHCVGEQEGVWIREFLEDVLPAT